MKQKTIIRLTESDLHKLIKESALHIISEMEDDITPETSPAENDYVTDAIDALNAMGEFDVNEGRNNIELDGEIYGYDVTFFCYGAERVEDTYDVPGVMDMSNFKVQVESVIATDEEGNEEDVTSILKQPLENELPEFINVNETYNPYEEDEM